MTTATIGPTKERIRKDRASYQPPEVSQTTKREYGRFKQWWETLEAKGSITTEQAMAAREFDTAWSIVTDAKGVVGSYGEQRWDGTPISQVDTSKLIGPEWREHCRSKVTAARNMLEIDQWRALLAAVKTNGNLGPVVLLAIGFASALYVNMPDVWVSAPALNRECSSAAECFDGERCERGKCVSSARKPRPPVRKNNQPSSSSGEDATGLALWWAPPYLRRDPYASIWDRY
jgi:hypothetical protein